MQALRLSTIKRQVVRCRRANALDALYYFRNKPLVLVVSNRTYDCIPISFQHGFKSGLEAIERASTVCKRWPKAYQNMLVVVDLDQPSKQTKVEMAVNIFTKATILCIGHEPLTPYLWPKAADQFQVGNEKVWQYR